MKNYQLSVIRRWTILFMILLILSGITAFPIETELRYLVNHDAFLPTFLRSWITTITEAVIQTNRFYPHLSYGTDWLAFAHLVIAVVFIGPLIDPVKNVWIFQFGMIACCMVFPLAFICGHIRHIPFYWQLIDCTFGVLGFIPLYICYSKVKSIENLNN